MVIVKSILGVSFFNTVCQASTIILNNLFEREFTSFGIRTYQIDDRYELIECVCSRRIVISETNERRQQHLLKVESYTRIVVKTKLHFSPELSEGVISINRKDT